MQRRHLLQALATSALPLAAPALARPGRAADVDAAFAANPLLRPFKGVTDATGDVSAEARLLGRWPTELRGRFYRNGPALFERGGERYHHWFDGDGMVQQFSLEDGPGPGGTRIRHLGRLVRTRKLQAEQQAGRFLFSTFGTAIDGTPPVGGPDAFNVANTNALEHGGRVLALWEGGSAYGLDPRDLSTQGPITWRTDLAQVPFSAHPKVDASGHLWNIGTSGKHLVVWHIDPAGQLVKVQLGESPFPGGMVHDMAVTARHLVVPLPPVRLDFGQAFGDGPRPFGLVPGEPLRVLVMAKDDIRQRRIFELPAQMVFHIGNAFEAADGQIELSFIGAPDTWFLNRGAVAPMAGQAVAAGPISLQVARLNLASGRVQVHGFSDNEEFPRVHPRLVGERSRWLLTAAGWPAHASRRGQGLLHGLQLRDTQTGRTRRFDYGEQQVAEEHVWVPKPGRHSELDAWLLGTTFDARRQATVLNLLDAAHIEDGPIAQAVLPYLLPLGFHGNFTAA